MEADHGPLAGVEVSRMEELIKQLAEAAGKNIDIATAIRKRSSRTGNGRRKKSGNKKKHGKLSTKNGASADPEEKSTQS